MIRKEKQLLIQVRPEHVVLIIINHPFTQNRRLLNSVETLITKTYRYLSGDGVDQVK
jgi:hypothetical protein